MHAECVARKMPNNSISEKKYMVRGKCNTFKKNYNFYMYSPGHRNISALNTMRSNLRSFLNKQERQELNIYPLPPK